MPKTILAIGAHADDCEIGVGGLLIQAKRAGCRVVVVTVVSDYSSWAPTRGHEEETLRELQALADGYGFEKRFLGYPYHVIDGGDLDLKRKLAEIQLEVKPDVAFIHHIEDHWPDHVACGRASHDALLFPHGLSTDLTSPRCPLVFAYPVTPSQTYHFDEDAYFDVTDVMPEYMDLINKSDACYFRLKSLDEEIQHELRTFGDKPQTLRLGGHAFLKLAYCIEHGNRAGFRYGLGLKTVWGRRLGEKLF